MCQNRHFSFSQNHKITECSGLEGTSVGHLVQPPCRSRVTQSRLPRTLSRRVLNISREGDSTTSLGSLFQCSVTLRVRKFFTLLPYPVSAQDRSAPTCFELSLPFSLFPLRHPHLFYIAYFSSVLCCSSLKLADSPFFGRGQHPMLIRRTLSVGFELLQNCKKAQVSQNPGVDRAL